MKRTLLCLGLLLGAVLPGLGKTIQFGGYEWNVRTGKGGPGPNAWLDDNVWLDAAGNLHLKIAQRDQQWSCAEITMKQRLGFGRYEFQIDGPLDRLDDNVVLGLFNYPTGDMGPDGTHEIDIEFARWGRSTNPIGNFTVWPAEKEVKQSTHGFPFTLETSQSTHRFLWSAENILFQSLHGYKSGDDGEFSRWTFHPDDAARRISRRPMPVHINLWLFKGLPPKDGREVEIVIHRFSFTPN